MDTTDTMETADGRRMLGAGDLSPLLGVSRPQVKELADQEWFPAPVVRLSRSAVWKMGDIQQMAAQTGRKLDYPAFAAHLAAMRERQRANPEFRRFF
jgi:predicted DNA-binding transcriptional regulator AlpA